MQVLTASSSEQIILMIRAGHRSSSSKSAPTRRSLHRLSRRRPPSRPRADGARDDGRGAVPRRLPPDRAPGHRPRLRLALRLGRRLRRPELFRRRLLRRRHHGRVPRLGGRGGARAAPRRVRGAESAPPRAKGPRTRRGRRPVRPRGGRRGSPRPPHGPPRGRRRGALGKRAKESTRRRRSRRRSRRRRRGRTPRRSPRRRHLRPHDDRLPPSSSSSTWSGATVPIVGPGRGTAASQALDWTKPVAAQLESQSRIARDALSRADAERAAGGDAAAEAFWRRRADPPRDPRRAAILLAAECVWLRELVEPFAETCAALMRPRGDAEACVLAFRDRSSAHRVVPGSSGSGGGSDVSSGGVVQHSGGGAFVPAAAVLEAFAARGCGCATTATFPSEEDEGFFVHIFEITPPAE